MFPFSTLIRPYRVSLTTGIGVHGEKRYCLSPLPSEKELTSVNKLAGWFILKVTLVNKLAGWLWFILKAAFYGRHDENGENYSKSMYETKNRSYETSVDIS